MAITFEGYERRINQINKTLNEYVSKISKKLRRSVMIKVLMFITSLNLLSLSASKMLAGLTL